jgi:hypothetical protein
MKSEILKRIIVSQQEEIEDKFKKSKIIPRAIDLKKIQSYLNIPNILAIAGIRRCGKSVLSWQIAQENKPFAYINFGCRHSEDPDEAPISSGRIPFDLTARSFIPTLSGFRMTSQHCHCGPDPQSIYELDAESRLCRDQHDKKSRC